MALSQLNILHPTGFSMTSVIRIIPFDLRLYTIKSLKVSCMSHHVVCTVVHMNLDISPWQSLSIVFSLSMSHRL